MERDRHGESRQRRRKEPAEVATRSRQMFIEIIIIVFIMTKGPGVTGTLSHRTDPYTRTLLHLSPVLVVASVVSGCA